MSGPSCACVRVCVCACERVAAITVRRIGKGRRKGRNGEEKKKEKKKSDYIPMNKTTAGRCNDTRTGPEEKEKTMGGTP